MFTLFSLGMTAPLDNSGSIVPGGRLTFREAGLETLKTVYADADGDVALSNPVVLNGYGRAAIYLNTDGAYDVEFHDADGEVLIWSLENVIAAAPAVED